jgi:hypothetical protein
MKKTTKVIGVLFAFSIVLSLLIPVGCGDAYGRKKIDPVSSVLISSNAETINFTSTVPTDPVGGYNATPEQMATFAWQEFIALNWPANPSTVTGSSGYDRGNPSSSTLGSTGPGGTVVWETFAHRVELYPADQTTSLPHIETKPIDYQYPSYVNITAPSGVNKNLFNNLDEASEIGLANMYYPPLAETGEIKGSLLYEAKANNVIYDYVQMNEFQNNTTRGDAAANTLKLITTNTDPMGKLFELPVGSTEMKATWRRYDSSADNLSDFHWTTAVYYTGTSVTQLMANNDTFLLIGLHVIQKTPSFPTFTFATFEHVSNEINGFHFTNSNAGKSGTTVDGRALPDTGLIIAARQFPIPGASDAFNLQAFNTQTQNQLKSQFGNDIVWANYQLIGIQGEVASDPTTSIPEQEFFLSNFATETNNTLQFFQGVLGGDVGNIPVPGTTNVYKANTSGTYQPYTAGGCKGCHGAASQIFGYDFSVISKTGNPVPDAVEEYPGGTPVPQNNAGFPLPK